MYKFFHFVQIKVGGVVFPTSLLYFFFTTETQTRWRDPKLISGTHHVTGVSLPALTPSPDKEDQAIYLTPSKAEG